MLYTKIQPKSFLSSGEEDFKCFTIYGCIFFTVVLFNGANPFEQIVNIRSTEGPM